MTEIYEIAWPKEAGSGGGPDQDGHCSERACACGGVSLASEFAGPAHSDALSQLGTAGQDRAIFGGTEVTNQLYSGVYTALRPTMSSVNSRAHRMETGLLTATKQRSYGSKSLDGELLERRRTAVLRGRE